MSPKKRDRKGWKLEERKSLADAKRRRRRAEKVAKELEATIPKTNHDKILDQLMSVSKKKEVEAVVVAYVKEHGNECYLCDDPVPVEQIAGQFCFGCRKLVCEKHTGDSYFGSHSVEAHDEPPEDEGMDEMDGDIDG